MENRKQITSASYLDGFLFTPSQELFLRASLLKTKEAVSAWNEISSSFDIDRIDPGSLRILPLLYKNLIFHGIKDPLLEKFKGVYRRTWYKNQILFHKMHSILGLLEGTGIKTMILKGASLVLLYYKDYGLRPMMDFDVMVQAADVECAVEVLSKAGWQPSGIRPLNRLTRVVWHAHVFNDANQDEFDLHWHLFPEYCAANTDDVFWKDSVKIQFNGLPICVLNHTDQLLHVLVHGAERNMVAGLRWVADAVMIMNEAQSQIDWQRLIRRAKELSLILSVKNNLNYLRRLVGLFVPEEIIREIEEIQISKTERLAYKAKICNTGIMGGLPASFYRYLIYAKLEKGGGFLKNFAAYVEFSKSYWCKEHFWQLLVIAISKTIKRLRFKIHDGFNKAHIDF
jgi:hypothetical protein